MPTRVFISYSHSDRKFVDRLVEDLKVSGVDVWLDRLEIKVGDSLTRKVSEGIHEAGYLAVVLSPHSVESEWVQRELNAGLVKGLNLKRVFLLPILKAPCDIPAIIADIKWADFRESYDLGFQELLARLVPEERRLSFEPETVLIPAGEFIMGSEESDREKPPHLVYLAAYRIGRYPLTNREYQAFVQGRGHTPPHRWEGNRYPEGEGDHPVINVSWHDAVAYCRWLSERTTRDYRLPTEADWEKAASWNSEAKRKRRYPWGDRFDSEKCNTSESAIKDTTPVGTYSPVGDSAYGIADMAGNVWEWCSTLYGRYPYDPTDLRETVEDEGARVLRGGAWCYSQWDARCAYRFRFNAGFHNLDVGFRVAASFDSPQLGSDS